jgi:hypothetical protein
LKDRDSNFKNRDLILVSGSLRPAGLSLQALKIGILNYENRGLECMLEL